MNQEDQIRMRNLFKSGTSIYWNPDNETCKKVIHVGKHEDEPGLCAMFENGEYVALFGCEVNDFIDGTRLKF